MAENGEQTILIRKRRKTQGHHVHHGGAWKVAYADFVTAMMAFFLLLWLLSTASQEQKEGLADYFSPVTVARSSQSGTGGLLGGETITTDGALASNRTPFGVTLSLPADSSPPSDTLEEMTEGEEIPAVEEYAEGDERPIDEAGRLSATPPDGRSLVLAEADRPDDGSGAPSGESLEVTPEELARLAELKAQRDFEEAVQQLREAVQAVPELAKLADNLLVDRTPEGMRLQLVDQQGTSMFKSGSALPEEHTRKLFALISQTLARLPNRIAIKGHTDAAPYRGDGSYSNWELSSDRALASRRALLEAGLDPSRIADVIGKADTDPLITGDPFDPQNRRISIILLNETVLSAAAGPPARAPAPAEAPPETPAKAPAAAPAESPAEAPAQKTVPAPAGIPDAHPAARPGPGAPALPSDDGRTHTTAVGEAPSGTAGASVARR